MKQRTAFILCAALLAVLCFKSAAHAAEQMRVYCEPPSAQSGKTLTLVMQTEHNPGLMGFKMTVTYDPAVLYSPVVVVGDITSAGSLNNSIGVSSEGCFDVLWTNTEGVTGDGSLLALVFSVGMQTEDTAVKIDFSETDTFTESWDPVEIEPLEIPITFDGANPKETEPASETADSAAPTSPGKSISEKERRDVLIAAVEKALEEANKKRIDEVDETDAEAFVSRVNELSAVISDGAVHPADSFDELLQTFAEAAADTFVEEALAAIGEEDLEELIGIALDAVGAESVDLVPAEKQQAFLQSLQQSLFARAPDVTPVSDRLPADEGMSAVAELQERIAEETLPSLAAETTAVPPENGSDVVHTPKKTALIIFTAGILITLCVIVIYITRKKKRGV